MSIIPLIMNLAHELESETPAMDSMWENDFGFGIHPVDLFRPRHHPLLASRRRYTPYTRGLMVSHRPSRHLMSGGKGGSAADLLDGHSSSIVPTIGKDGFQVCMDVAHFKPNELTVKTIDNTIVVEGKHEEREDEHGMVQRHFVRKYTLPKDYDAKEVVSTISSDGVLTVKAPPPPNKAVKHNERIVQIQQTGPAHLSVKAPEETNEQKGQAQNGGNSREKAAAAAK